MNVVQAFDHQPHIHRRVLAWLESCRERGIRVFGQGLTTDAGFTFTFEDWNLFDDSQAWCEATTGTREERLASSPIRRGAPRCATTLPITATGPIEIAIVGPKLDEEQEVARLHAGPCRREDGQASRRRDPRHRRRRGPRDGVLRRPAQRQIEHLKEIVDDPYVLFGVSDGGAHTKFLTAGRYPTETHHASWCASTRC